MEGQRGAERGGNEFEPGLFRVARNHSIASEEHAGADLGGLVDRAGKLRDGERGEKFAVCGGQRVPLRLINEIASFRPEDAAGPRQSAFLGLPIEEALFEAGEILEQVLSASGRLFGRRVGGAIDRLEAILEVGVRLEQLGFLGRKRDRALRGLRRIGRDSPVEANRESGFELTEEVTEAFEQRRRVSSVESGHDVALEVDVKVELEPLVLFENSLDGVGAVVLGGEAVSFQLVLARDAKAGANERFEQPVEEAEREGRMAFEEADQAVDGLLRFEDPGPERKRAAMEVAEFVSDQGGEFSAIENREEGKPKGEDALRADAGETGIKSGGRVGLRGDQDQRGKRLPRVRRDILEEAIEARLLARIQGDAVQVEFGLTRDHCPGHESSEGAGGNQDHEFRGEQSELRRGQEIGNRQAGEGQGGAQNRAEVERDDQRSGAKVAQRCLQYIGERRSAIGRFPDSVRMSVGMDHGQLEATFRELLSFTAEERERGLAKLEIEDPEMAGELRELFAVLPEAEGWFARLDKTRRPGKS